MDVSEAMVAAAALEASPRLLGIRRQQNTESYDLNWLITQVDTLIAALRAAVPEPAADERSVEVSGSVQGRMDTRQHRYVGPWLPGPPPAPGAVPED